MQGEVLNRTCNSIQGLLKLRSPILSMLYLALLYRVVYSIVLYFYLGTNCLTAFIITPIVGNNLNLIGVKFAYCSGLFLGKNIILFTNVLWFKFYGKME